MFLENDQLKTQGKDQIDTTSMDPLEKKERNNIYTETRQPPIDTNPKLQGEDLSDERSTFSLWDDENIQNTPLERMNNPAQSSDSFIWENQSEGGRVSPTTVNAKRHYGGSPSEMKAKKKKRFCHFNTPDTDIPFTKAFHPTCGKVTAEEEQQEEEHQEEEEQEKDEEQYDSHHIDDPVHGSRNNQIIQIQKHQRENHVLESQHYYHDQVQNETEQSAMESEDKEQEMEKEEETNKNDHEKQNNSEGGDEEENEEEDNEEEEEEEEENGDDNEEEEDDEEDEEDETKIDETLEGFIVNELPESEEDSKEEEEEEDEEDEQPVLDDDDLELIAENTGISRSHPSKPPTNKFRRLKKIMEDEESDEKPISPSHVKALNHLHKGRYQKNTTSRYRSRDQRFPLPKANEDDHLSESKDYSDDETFGLHPRLLALIRHIFGDVGTVMEILGRRRHREESMEDYMENTITSTLSAPPLRGERFTTLPSSLADHPSLLPPSAKPSEEESLDMNVENEATLCRVNKPERHVLLYNNRRTYYPLDILKKEAGWIAARIMNIGLDTLNLTEEKLKEQYLQVFGCKSHYYDPEKKTVEEDLTEKISIFLHLLLNEYLEAPTIILHFGHRLCPPLTDRLSWLIVDFDQEWSRLAQDAECVLKLVDRLNPDSPDLLYLRQKLMEFKNEIDIDDVRHYVNFYSKDVMCDSSRQGRKHAASSASISLSDIQRYSLDKHWNIYLLSHQDFASNIEKSEAFASLVSSSQSRVEQDLSIEQLPLSEPPLPGRSPEALNAWLSSFCSGPFNTGPRVLEALLSLESRKLAVSVRVRDCLRRWFYSVAKITTVLTDSGRKAVTLGKRNWPALNLRRKPVQELLSSTIPPLNTTLSYNECYHHINEREYLTREATAFLDILHAESLEQVSILIHPLVPNDVVPWRSSNDTLNPLCCEKLNLLVEEVKSYEDEDKHILDTLLHILTNLYVINPSSLWATEVQIKILQRLVYRELVVLFRKELRSHLQRRAELCVSILCYDALKWRLSLQPYRRTKKKFNPQLYDDSGPSDGIESDELSDTSQESQESEHLKRFSQSSRPLRTCGLVIKRSGKNVCLHALCVDRHGFPTHYRRFESLLTSERQGLLPPSSSSIHWKNDETFSNAIRQLFKQAKTELVVIAASDILAKHLYETLVTLGEKVKHKIQLDVVFASLEVPRLYAVSHACSREHKKVYGVEGCQAMCLARLLQDPLACHLQLWSKGPESSNLLLHLKYHPLQHLLVPERLESALEQAAITMVASVGVDLNYLRQKPYTQCLLQFVPGLGPTKAQFLMSNLFGPVHCRSAILKILDQITLDNQKLGKTNSPFEEKRGHDISMNVVYRNCASFLRLDTTVCLLPNASDPLACTRAHPFESYTTAYKTARDALEDTKGSMTPQTCVTSVILNPSCLDDLDLEEYSYILEEKGQCRMLYVQPIYRFRC